MKIQKHAETQLWLATMQTRAGHQFTASGFSLAGAMISLYRLVSQEARL